MPARSSLMLDSSVARTYVELEMDHRLNALNWDGAARLLAQHPEGLFGWLPQTWLMAGLHAPLDLAQAVINQAQHQPSMNQGIAKVFEAWSKWSDEDLKRPDQRHRRWAIVQTLFDQKIKMDKIAPFAPVVRNGFAQAIGWKDPAVLDLMFKHPDLAGSLIANSFEKVDERWGGDPTLGHLWIKLPHLAVLMNDREITSILLKHGVRFDGEAHERLGTPLDMALRGQASEFLVAYEEHQLEKIAQHSLSSKTLARDPRARI